MAARLHAVTRLSLDTLGRLPVAVRPAADPRELPVRIVHLGLGAFHRAHQAVYTEDAGGWGICGVTQRSRAVADALAPQDGLYAMCVRSGEGERYRVLGAVREALWAREDPDALLRRIADPTVTVVTLTVTEKAYHRDPATDRLRVSDPDVAADLEHGGTRTVLGQLVQALDRRRRDSGAPLTIICCDNLPSNGRVLGALVDDFAARLPGGVALQTWIAGHVRFPSTMVDRIVPATTDGDRAAATRALGFEDRGLVVTEPFTQWVIEDAFAAPRPAWERAGAVLVNDVAPYEQIKLRMLNGSHSLLAYLGQLADCELLSDAVADDGLRAAATGLMASDVAPTLNVPDGVDLAGYQHDLLARFANPALRHRTAQIAMDGSQKLPQRLLGTIRDRRRAGAEPALAALGVAAWMRYVSARRSDSGRPLTIDDPLADVIAERVGERSDPGAVVDGLLGMRAVFPEDLASDEPLRTQLIELVQRLAADGAAATAARITGERSAA